MNGWAKAGQLLSICTSASAQAALCRAAASAAPAPSARATCASPSSDQPLLGCCARSCRAAATARQQQHMKQRHARASLKLCCLKAVCDHSVGDAGCLPLICHRNASRLVMTQSRPGLPVTSSKLKLTGSCLQFSSQAYSTPRCTRWPPPPAAPHAAAASPGTAAKAGAACSSSSSAAGEHQGSCGADCNNKPGTLCCALGDHQLSRALVCSKF